MFYVISYDIVEDKIRNKISKYLESKSVRVQKSVFEANWSKKTLSEVKLKLYNLINNKTDTVRIYRLCSACQSDITNFGCVPIFYDNDIEIY
jgi:CRISPR-associated protein Cas2